MVDVEAIAVPKGFFAVRLYDGRVALLALDEVQSVIESKHRPEGTQTKIFMKRGPEETESVDSSEPISVIGNRMSIAQR